AVLVALVLDLDGADAVRAHGGVDLPTGPALIEGWLGRGEAFREHVGPDLAVGPLRVLGGPHVHEVVQDRGVVRVGRFVPGGHTGEATLGLADRAGTVGDGLRAGAVDVVGAHDGRVVALTDEVGNSPVL